MKILHYIGSPGVGGVTSVVYNISRYAQSRGHSVDIYSMCVEDDFGDITDTYTRSGIKVIPADTPSRYSLRKLRKLRRLMGNYDIVHIHQFPQQMWGAVAAMLRGKGKGPKIVTTEHSTWNNRRDKQVLRIFDRWMYDKYDRIACISPSASEELKKWLSYDKLNSRIVTITNGIDITKYADAENHIADYTGGDTEGRFIAMAARLDHPKDPFTLIRALPLLPENVKIIFLGDGKLLPEAEKLARELGVDSRVYLPGYVPDISSIIKGCSIGVLSTFWDGFGLVAAEYMAAGIPAVVSDVAGLRDVVGDPELLFPTGDHERLAGILNRLLSDPGYYDSKVAAGRERVNLFSCDEMGSKYLDMYTSLLRDSSNKTNEK